MINGPFNRTDRFKLPPIVEIAAMCLSSRGMKCCAYPPAPGPTFVGFHQPKWAIEAMVYHLNYVEAGVSQVFRFGFYNENIKIYRIDGVVGQKLWYILDYPNDIQAPGFNPDEWIGKAIKGSWWRRMFWSFKEVF